MKLLWVTFAFEVCPFSYFNHFITTRKAA